MNDLPETGSSRYVNAPDGLRLHLREDGPRDAPRLPVICLPGLSRTTADFEMLSRHLAYDPLGPRRVLGLDSRGRGRSDYDRDPANYNLTVELNDLLAVLKALEIGPAVFIGTSRGGLLTMLLASAFPAAVAGAVLNDIGPVIEISGLKRLQSYIGKLSAPDNLDDAAARLARQFGAQFPRLTAEDWLAEARRVWRSKDGKLLLNYDPALADNLRDIDFSKPFPDLWPQFDALAGVPLMSIRGGLSDIFSGTTLAAMRLQRPDIDVIEISDQGHPPLLNTPALLARISAFVRRCDTQRR